MRSLLWSVLSIAVIAASWSAAAPAQAPAPAVTLFEGARVITGDGRAPLENASFVVSGGRFSQVGSAASVRVPAGAARARPPRQTGLPARRARGTPPTPTRGAPAAE